MKNYKSLFVIAALSAWVVSCSDTAQIKGVLTDSPDTEVVLKQLSGSSVIPIDTVKTNADGAYSYRVNVPKGQPEFFYLYEGGTRIASLILFRGDKVRIVSDSLGNCSVEGSVESAKLQQAERDFSDFLDGFTAAAQAGDNRSLSKQYIDYYRSRVRYVMENAKSLSSIPVLYQKINENFPVFSQATDAIHFKNVYDSLMTVYPDSKYVKALGKEAEGRYNALNLGIKMRNAREMSFPDLNMPMPNGSRKRLSEVDARVVMLYFWLASDPAQKLFNQDVLIPVYNEYHVKGFEIYAVSLDTDKGIWASAVKNQELPWINVCDGLGTGSQAAILYNVNRSLPVSFMIIGGELGTEKIQGADDLRKLLASRL